METGNITEYCDEEVVKKPLQGILAVILLDFALIGAGYAAWKFLPWTKMFRSIFGA
jgi:hypothetical protein